MSSQKPGLKFVATVTEANNGVVCLSTTDPRAMPYFKKIIGVKGVADFTYDPTYNAHDLATGNLPEPDKD
jgi:hypothetical protein